MPEPVKRARMEVMLALARESTAAYRRQFLGRTMPVLWEASRPTPPSAPSVSRPIPPGPPSLKGRGEEGDPPSRPYAPHLVGEGAVWEGLTDNYIRVYGHAPADVRNEILPVRLVADAGDALWGELERGTGSVERGVGAR